MKYCYVKFKSDGNEPLMRLKHLFDLIKIEKTSPDEIDEKTLIDYLEEREKNYFWNPSEEEQNEWDNFWSATAVDVRLSPQMALPPWHLETMFEAFWNGDYELVSISEKDNLHYLNFDPFGYPYGGTGCMVALIECFGHSVVGIEDGTGYVKYTPHKILWEPGMKPPTGKRP